MDLEHIAFIMDGNGRWAKYLGKERTYGHKKGLEIIRKVVEFAKKEKIKFVTFFAFSTENWKRPKEEVDYIFKLLNKFIAEYLEKYENDFSLNIIGDINFLDQESKNSISKLKQVDFDSNLVVNIAINYGSRQEIIRAINNIIKDNKKEITEEEFSNYLYTKGIKDPDLLVRTSGEKRISNFLLYQIAYTELMFIDKNWPEITVSDLKKIVKEYNKRQRRFGGINA